MAPAGPIALPHSRSGGVICGVQCTVEQLNVFPLHSQWIVFNTQGEMRVPTPGLRLGLSRTLASLQEACQTVAGPVSSGLGAAEAAAVGGGTAAVRPPARPPRLRSQQPQRCPWPAPLHHHNHGWRQRAPWPPHSLPAAAAAAGGAAPPGAAAGYRTSPHSAAGEAPAAGAGAAASGPGFVRGGFRLEDFPPERIRNFSIVVRARRRRRWRGKGGGRAWRVARRRRPSYPPHFLPPPIHIFSLLSPHPHPQPTLLLQAHIDHGKSTLSDRLMQRTGAVAAGARAQYLDRLQVGLVGMLGWG
jgi:hypothetical protein